MVCGYSVPMDVAVLAKARDIHTAEHSIVSELQVESRACRT
jgi:hypothetical protein